MILTCVGCHKDLGDTQSEQDGRPSILRRRRGSNSDVPCIGVRKACQLHLNTRQRAWLTRIVKTPYYARRIARLQYAMLPLDNGNPSGPPLNAFVVTPDIDTRGSDEGAYQPAWPVILDKNAVPRLL